jgi:hypothetical protein
MSQGYPKNLQYLARKLNGFSKNTFKILSLNATTASANQIITVDLPSNSLVDLSSFTMFFNASTTATSLPKNIESLIERYEVSVNGVTVQGGCNNYHQLFNTISDMTMSQDCVNRRKILQNSDISTAVTSGSFAIQNWLGFISSVSPNIIDTGLLGNVRVRITLASTDALVGTGTYDLTNMFFSVDCISIDDGIFYNIHQQFLNSGGVYEMPFKQWFNFSSTGGLSQSTNFSLSTGSMNRAIACFVKQGAGLADAITTNAPMFTRVGEIDSSNKVTSWQFSIGGKYYPNYKPTPDQAFALMMNNLNMSQDTLGGINPKIDTLAHFKSSFWVASIELEHGDSGFISGLDTRGNVSQNFFETQGVSATNYTCLVFVETTSLLRVGAGRNIDVVT